MAIQKVPPHIRPNDETTKDNTKRRGSSDVWWMVILTAIIAISTAANVAVFYLESEDLSAKMVTLSEKAGEIVGSMNKALADNRMALDKAFEVNRLAVKASEEQAKRLLDSSKIQSEAATAASERQNERVVNMMRTQLDSTERAWISVDPKIDASGLTFDPDGTAHLGVAFRLKNIGHAAAYATVNPRLLFVNAKRSDIHAPNTEQDRLWCGWDPDKPPKPGFSETNPRQEAKSITVFPESTAANELHIELSSPSPFENLPQPELVLIGCITYQHASRKDIKTEFYRTAFIYSVIPVDTEFSPRGVIPPDQLRLEWWTHGGDFAQ